MPDPTDPPPPPGSVAPTEPDGRRRGVARPDRHLELPDLPPAVAARLEFDRAAPRRLRSSRLPDQVQDELRDLWNGIIADVYDEVAGLRRTKAFRRDAIERSLHRIAERLLQAERVVIVAGVHYPMRGERTGRYVAVAGVGGGSSAVVEEVAAFGSFGTATTIAIVSAVVGEIFETYVAASARTRQYLQQQRSPDPASIVIDLAEASGYGDSAGRRATAQAAHNAAAWLGDQLVRRTASRFARSLVPVVGVGAGAGISAWGVHRVTRLPLRPVSAQEVRRLADEVISDPHSYEVDRDRFLALTDPAASPAGEAAPDDGGTTPAGG
jgi:hypothetical protein